MPEALLTETYSVWPQVRSATRVVLLLSILTGIVYLALIRDEIMPRTRPVVVAPVEERLPLQSFIAQERNELERRQYEKRLLAIEEKAKTLVAAAAPPKAFPRDELAALLLELEAVDRERIGKTLRAHHAELTEAYEDKQAETEKQRRLAEQKKRQEAMRRREEERRRKLAEARRAAAERARAAQTEKASQDKSDSTAPAVDNAAAAYRDKEITKPVPGAYVTVYLERRFMGLTLGKTYIRQYHRIAVPENADESPVPAGTYRIVVKDEGDNGRRLVLAKKDQPLGEIPAGGGIAISPNIDGTAHTDSGLAIEPPQFEELWTATQPGMWVVVRP